MKISKFLTALLFITLSLVAPKPSTLHAMQDLQMEESFDLDEPQDQIQDEATDDRANTLQIFMLLSEFKTYGALPRDIIKLIVIDAHIHPNFIRNLKASFIAPYKLFKIIHAAHQECVCTKTCKCKNYSLDDLLIIELLKGCLRHEEKSLLDIKKYPQRPLLHQDCYDTSLSCAECIGTINSNTQEMTVLHEACRQKHLCLDCLDIFIESAGNDANTLLLEEDQDGSTALLMMLKFCENRSQAAINTVNHIFQRADELGIKWELIKKPMRSNGASTLFWATSTWWGSILIEFIMQAAPSDDEAWRLLSMQCSNGTRGTVLHNAARYSVRMFKNPDFIIQALINAAEKINRVPDLIFMKDRQHKTALQIAQREFKDAQHYRHGGFDRIDEWLGNYIKIISILEAAETKYSHLR